ncbi:MAG: hypothetical protein ABIG95_03285 [Candidatus Woesearchaeota archaeon]
MILLSKALKHYKRPEIQKAILEHSKEREIAIRYGDKGFGKRPDSLKYPADVLEAAKQGASSFHCSEELWQNPLQLDVSMSKKDLDTLRSGWDLVLDIDCAVLEYSQIAADLLVKALKFYNIMAVSCKYSGNKGFHIGVPFEAFPSEVNGKSIVGLFPEGARAIALYLRDMIKQELANQILQFEKNDFAIIAKKTGKTPQEIVSTKSRQGLSVQTLNLDSFLQIDTILISSRHMYRMPYSLHEKSQLVSIPINPDRVLQFNKLVAKPENVKVSKYKFLDQKNINAGEGKQLLVQALDYNIKRYVATETKPVEIPEVAIPEQFFPPCIKIGLQGLIDGRKRFLFSLQNFLGCVGWSTDQIEELVSEWNQKNNEPLRETITKGQLRYSKQRKQVIMPPNCQNLMYYLDIGICKPDNLCSKIKNPVQYAKRKTRFLKL